MQMRSSNKIPQKVITRLSKQLIAVLLGILFLFSFTPAKCITKSPFIDIQYHIEHLLEDDGLPHIDVYDAIEDSTGFIWLATLSGLCRYDGYKIQTLYENESDADRVRTKSVLLDRNNNLWIGSEKGIKYLDTYSDKFIPVELSEGIPHGLKDEQVHLELYDSRGYLWGKINNVLYVFGTDKSRIISAMPLSEIIPGGFNAFYHDVIEDRNSNIWIGTHKGLLHLVYTQDEFHFEKIINLESKPFSLAHESAISLYIDQNGDLIVGSIEGMHIIQLTSSLMNSVSQVRQIDYLSVREQPVIGSADAVNQMSAAIVNSVVQDDFGDYWLGTDVGLLKLEMAPDLYQSRFVLLRAAMNSNTHLSSNIINSSFLTRNGSLVICTFGGGVNIIDTHQKRINYLYADHFANAISLSENHVRAITEDKKGNIWVGYQSSGISYIDLEKKEKQDYTFKIVDSRNNRNNIRTLYLEDERYLWIGTLKELLCFDVQEKRLIELPKALQDSAFRENGYITNIKVDVYNNLWISNWAGGVLHCVRSNDKTFEFESIERFSTNSRIKILDELCNYVLLVSNKRNVMVSTRTGIEKFFLDANGNVIDVIHYNQRSNTPDKLSSDFVWDIVEMNPALFYAGTIEGGLNRIQLTDSIDENGLGIYHAEHIQGPNHFKIDNIECLLKDKYNNLWLAGKSLYYYDTRKGIIEPYDFSKSTFGNSFKVGSSFSGRSGNMYFGGTKGLCYFNPDNIRSKTSVPKTQITRLEIHNQNIRPHIAYDGYVLLNIAIYNTQYLQLNHLQNNFTLYFSSLQYDNPQSIRYKYRLIGVDKDWMLTTGEKPFVTYTNLKSRRYNFEVMSSNIDGVWSHDVRTLHLRIRPPWYLSISMIVVYVFIILSAIVYLYYYQWRFLKIKNALDIQKLDEKKKEELYNEKFIFFTNVSHELRTPLTLIISPLHDMMKAQTNITLKNQLRFIYKNAERMLYKINELIQFRKVETGLTKLRSQKTIINKQLREICSQFNDWANRNHIEYVLNIPEHSLEGWIDRDKFETIVYNLLTNAFKYTADGGKVTVSCFDGNTEIPLKQYKNCHSFGAQPQGRVLSVMICDTGLGIRKESLKSIFDRFYQENGNGQNSSGIGMALVKNLTILHKGYFEIASSEGAGTDILFVLPISESAFEADEKLAFEMPMAKRMDVNPKLIFDNTGFDTLLLSDSEDDLSTPTEKHLNGRRETILIIEDDDQIRQYLEVSLGKRYNIVDTGDGLKGMQMLNEIIPDMVICDVMLPKLSGFEICRNAKAGSTTSHIPIIILTAKTDLSDKMTGASVGADVYIEKPFSLAYLVTEIENVFKNRRKILDKESRSLLYETHLDAISKKDEKFVKALFKVIKTHMGKSDFGIDMICKEMGITRSNFYIKVKQVTSKTPNELIKEFRLDLALHYMVKEGVSVTDTAYKIGMTPTFFSKAFKERYKETPSIFLKNLKENAET